MNWEQWSAVDRYINETLVQENSALNEALRSNAAADLPAIDVSPAQGRQLQLLARMIGARRILEVGTLGGYSTIWMARALPDDGALISFEAEPRYADVAVANVAHAELADRVDIRVGDAHELFPKLIAEQPEPFDFVFIDADKQSNPEYFRWALDVTRSGGVIVVDNVIRNGAIVDDPDDPGSRGARELHELLGREPRVSATTIQTVGSKGWDGFAIALVN
jgi:predicted O-methyltransferase YrrM